MPESVRDEMRGEVAARGLTPAAVAHLTHDALGTIDFAVLAPVKKLLKQFFSAEPWSAPDIAALSDLVGAGTGWWRYDLDDDFALEFGWRDGRFRLGVASRSVPADAFAGPVVPEATPNPRTIRFVTGPIHDGPSRWYESAASAADDTRAARLFAEFDDVVNVLIGPDFVAVGLRRPEEWEQQLGPILGVVTTEFAANSADEPFDSDAPAGPVSAGSEARSGGAVARAWKELGALRPGDPADLERILRATADTDIATRQVAARLLVGAEFDVTLVAWSRLLGDPSRAVRRATVDAMVDAAQPELRPVLERALDDGDAWTRWKALRGLVDLGIAPSRAAVAPLAEDPDFRVRLEAARALAVPRGM